MGLIKKRRYYFTDDSIASDTVIAFVTSGLALSIELLGVIWSIATAGNVPDIFGSLYLCAIVLSLCAIFFALLGNKAEKGGVKGKRVSIGLSLLALVLPLLIIF